MVDNSHRRRSGHPAAATTAVAVLFVICLVECATANCRQYGHSCWGAHGKRSGVPRARDYFPLSLLARSMTENDLDRIRQTMAENDVNALLEREAKDVSETNNEGSSPEMVSNGDDIQSQIDENDRKAIIANIKEFLAALRTRERN